LVFIAEKNFKSVYFTDILTYLLNIVSISMLRYFVNIVSLSHRNRKSDIEASLQRTHRYLTVNEWKT